MEIAIIAIGAVLLGWWSHKIFGTEPPPYDERAQGRSEPPPERYIPSFYAGRDNR